MTKMNWGRVQSENRMHKPNIQVDSRSYRPEDPIPTASEPWPRRQYHRPMTLADRANALLQDNQRPRCECGKTMRVREAKATRNVFWACPGFPDCRKTRPIDQRRFALFIAGTNSSERLYRKRMTPDTPTKARSTLERLIPSLITPLFRIILPFAVKIGGLLYCVGSTSGVQ